MDSNVEWTLKSLISHLNMPSTTVYRQVSTLTNQGYLIQDPVRKSYRVGPKLLLLASTILSQSDLRRSARPELEKLSLVVKETINLSILLEKEIFILTKLRPFRSVVCNTKIGSRAPAHATSSGKAMLAYMEPAIIDNYCNALPSMQPITDRTIVSEDRLRSELIKARLDGYAIDDGEIESGLFCVGAPIFGINQNVLAAVSIAGPSFRMKAELDVMIREIKHTASNISRLLGGIYLNQAAPLISCCHISLHLHSSWRIPQLLPEPRWTPHSRSNHSAKTAPLQTKESCMKKRSKGMNRA